MRLLLTHFHLRLSSVAAPSRSSECLTLLSVKSAVTDDPQSFLTSWNTAANCCTWRGVTCDSSGEHVTALDVSGLGLVGALSPDVGQLRFLVNFSTAANFFSGPIPPEIADIPNLRRLNLSNNVFNLTFPPQLYRLKNLQVLDLYNNNLTGDFPSQAYLLANLQYLHLGGNFFTGEIPPEFGSFPRLEYLAVSGNELTGSIPPEIGNLSTPSRRRFPGGGLNL